MTEHTHRERVDGCYRCDLSADEVSRQLEPVPPLTGPGSTKAGRAEARRIYTDTLNRRRQEPT